MKKNGLEYLQGYLTGKSYTSSDVNSMFNEKFDVVVLTSSWDQRCIEITKAKRLKSHIVIPVLFDQRDPIGLRDIHDPMIINYSEACGKTVLVKGSSLKIAQLWAELSGKLKAAYVQLGKQLRVMIDISCCPRYYILAILSLVLKSKMASSVTFFYTEGKYPQKTKGEEEIAFSGERWKAIAVPGFEGEYSPSKRRFYLVSAGFEGWKALRAVSKADPDRVSMLMPEPGVRAEYIERTKNDNVNLINEYLIPPKQIVCAEAGDIISAWKALGNQNLDRPDTENSYYLCCGTKPHAVALGLRALVLGYPTVLYALPDEHKFVRVESAGKYWRCDITDLTAMPLESQVRNSTGEED